MKHLPVFIRIICARSFSCSCQPIDILVKLFPHGSIFLSPRGLSHLVLMTIMCPFYPMSGATTTIFFTVKFSPPPFFGLCSRFFCLVKFRFKHGDTQATSTETCKPCLHIRSSTARCIEHIQAMHSVRDLRQRTLSNQFEMDEFITMISGIFF